MSGQVQPRGSLCNSPVPLDCLIPKCGVRTKEKVLKKVGADTGVSSLQDGGCKHIFCY